jgi:hypothetical protein
MTGRTHAAQFQLARAGVQRPSAAVLAAMRQEYEAKRCVTLPGFLDPYVIAWLQRRAKDGRWIENVHDALDPPAIDLMLVDDVAIGAVTAMTNTPEVFETVQAITGCDPIGCFKFRMYQISAGYGHDTWHGDDDGNRLVTLSINVGAEPFEGGGLRLRERASGRLVHRAHNTVPGDAILFRIGPDLEHFVEEVTGPSPKIALAGWFQREPRGNIAGPFP